MNMKKVIISIIFILLFGSTLGVAIPSPIGVQKNDVISYSSEGLQNSSWPMFQHDVQHTGRSPYAPNGNTPVVKWKFWMDGMMISSPSIDENGTIYIGAEDFHDSFFAINPDGTEKWRFGTGDYILSSPAIAADGTIYIGSNNGKLYAFYQNGTLKWRATIGNGWVKSSPVIDSDGIVYAGSFNSNRLCAVYPNGTIRWEFYTENSIICSPALDNEGVIYIGGYDGYMYAIYPNGTLKWRYFAGGIKGIQSSPTIDTDGTIYFGSTSGYLYALCPDGTEKWRCNTGYIDDSSPAVAIDGTIYIGSTNGKIYSIRPDGSIKWSYQTNKEIFGSPAIDKSGIMYIGSLNGNLYALNPDGALRWKFSAGDGIQSSPSIGKDGTIYIAGYFQPSGENSSCTYLYALDFINNTAPNIPDIDGETEGTINTEYTYTAVTSDPENNNISYFFNWDDGTTSGWLEFVPSGTEIQANHTWTQKGTYTIQVKAKDDYDAESDWATLEVTMPRNKAVFDIFQSKFPILAKLLTLTINQ